MKRAGIGWRVVVATVVAVLTLAAARGADPAPTIEDVKKAWKARQEANKSFRVEWVETVKVKAGGIRPKNPVANPGPHPPKDHEFTAAYSFAADGEKVAGTLEEQIYYVDGKTWKPYLTAGRFDGQTSTEVYPLYRPGWGHVTIRSGKDRLDAGLHSITNKPVLRLYLPLGSGVFPKLEFEKAKLSGRTEKIGGTTCAEVVIEGAAPGSTYSVWCDPARGFLPIRESDRYSAGNGFDFAWSYRKDAQGQLVLAGWEFRQVNSDGVAWRTAKAEVKKLDLDHKFAADAFAPKPPPSSHVTVYEDGRRKDEYLVRPDGSKRPLKPSEREKDYDELIKTNADGTPYVPPKK